MDGSDVDAGDRARTAEEGERLRRAVDEERQKYLRLLADFDNFRRRGAREQEAARLEARRAALLTILSVVDSFDRALAAGSTDPDFYEGMTATHRQFLTALREAGAEPVESVGLPFDPRLHEIVGTVAPEDGEAGIVVREVRRGWRLGDELLRPAQVIVPRAEEPGPGDPWR